MNRPQTEYLNAEALRNVFASQLSLLYAAKSHLTESLPALVEHAGFVTLKHALVEDIEDSKKQMILLRQIFIQLEESPMTQNCLGMNAIIKEAYEDVLYLNGKNYDSDMSIMFYMGVIQHMQIGAGRMLNLIAKNTTYAAYADAIAETMDMTKDNADLFNLIAEEYIGKN